MRKGNHILLIVILIVLLLIDIALPSFDNKDIILNLRLPRTLSIVLTGSFLASSGFIVQRLTSNPLADPFIIGTSSGAMLGILLCEFLKLVPYGFLYFLTVNGLTLLTLYLSWSLAEYLTRPQSILLSGIAINSLVLSFIVLYVIFSRETTISFFHISFGSFSYSEWSLLLYAFVVCVISFFIIVVIWKDLVILSFNPEKAISLGVSQKIVRFLAFTSSAFLTSTSVSLSGIIGFVGLMSSHISSLFCNKTKHLAHFISTIFVGSILLLISDIISRYLFYPVELPPGVFTSILGSVFFLYLVINSKR